MTLAPLDIKYLIVGTAARMRVSSVILKESSKGTLRSALINTFFPFKSPSFKLPTLFFVAISDYGDDDRFFVIVFVVVFNLMVFVAKNKVCFMVEKSYKVCGFN